MNKEVKNLIGLYTYEKEKLKEVLFEKRNWINNKFYISGNIEKVIDNNGLIHYTFIENFYSSALTFVDPIFDEENFKTEEIMYLKECTKDFKVLYLNNEILKNDDSLFFVEVDFTKLELGSYYLLYPNFFHTIDKEKLEIDLTKPDFLEIVKSVISTKTSQNLIILEKNRLVNSSFYAPIFTKIFYKKEISNDLLETLHEIGNKLNIEVVLL